MIQEGEENRNYANNETKVSEIIQETNYLGNGIA